MTAFALDAYVIAALFPQEGSAFVTADGQVRFGEATVTAHEGAAMAAAVHPSGSGVVSCGDDGRLVWSRPGGAETLAEVKGKWFDQIAVSPASGLIAFSSGREIHLRDAKTPKFSNVVKLERACAGLAFEPKGLRLAAATYGGAALLFARIVDQKPQ